MTYDDSYNDRYEHYAADFDPLNYDRQARRKRKAKKKHQPKKDESEILAEIADTSALEADFKTTYRPSHYEEGWLISSLRTFYTQGIITDVLGVVKGGKEANVYLCEAHPTTGEDYVAAKVYRPRRFRNMKDDTMYREGRTPIGVDGKKIRENDRRAIRAIEKRSAYGTLVEHTSWLMHEYNTLEVLYRQGGAVPRPLGSGENALLMTYVGDAGEPAPTLNEIHLDEDEAEPLFDEVMRNIKLMLAKGFVHGDLSAYNILYWQGNVTLIDFPQVIDAHNNSNVERILKRDIVRVCDYFQRFGVGCDGEALGQALWEDYFALSPEEVEADHSRYLNDDE